MTDTNHPQTPNDMSGYVTGIDPAKVGGDYSVPVNTSEDELLTLFSANFNDGEPIVTRIGSKDMYSADAIVEFIRDFAAPYTKERERLVVQEYEDDLLHALDDISNKPWRAIRHIRELFESHKKKDSDWYKEVAYDYALLEEFMSNGGMNTVRQLMADPKFNVNYPSRIAELEKEKLQ